MLLQKQNILFISNVRLTVCFSIDLPYVNIKFFQTCESSSLKFTVDKKIYIFLLNFSRSLLQQALRWTRGWVLKNHLHCIFRTLKLAIPPKSCRVSGKIGLILRLTVHVRGFVRNVKGIEMPRPEIYVKLREILFNYHTLLYVLSPLLNTYFTFLLKGSLGIETFFTQL